MAGSISFHSEEIKFVLKEKTLHKEWLMSVAKKEGYTITELNYVFCSDGYLYQMNVEYLQHDTYTDIITFDNSEDKKQKEIEGDIFISIDRIKENAHTFEVGTEEELRRVMAHGILHLMGYKDKAAKDKALMREGEERALKLYRQMKSPNSKKK